MSFHLLLGQFGIPDHLVLFLSPGILAFTGRAFGCAPRFLSADHAGKQIIPCTGEYPAKRRQLRQRWKIIPRFDLLNIPRR